jgi:hypothetical protein
VQHIVKFRDSKLSQVTIIPFKNGVTGIAAFDGEHSYITCFHDPYTASRTVYWRENVSPGNRISSQKVLFKKSKSDTVNYSKRCHAIQKVISVLIRSHHCVIWPGINSNPIWSFLSQIPLIVIFSKLSWSTSPENCWIGVNTKPDRPLKKSRLLQSDKMSLCLAIQFSIWRSPRYFALLGTHLFLFDRAYYSLRLRFFMSTVVVRADANSTHNADLLEESDEDII